MNGLRYAILLAVINILNDLRTARKAIFLSALAGPLQYVTRTTHFDLVEITFRSIDSAEDFSASLYLPWNPLWRKNEVSRIYVIRFMAWKWNEQQKEGNIAGRTFTTDIFVSRGQYIFKYYAFFSSSFDCHNALEIWMSILGNLAKSFCSSWYHKNILRRHCQKVLFGRVFSEVSIL